ncbi:hypothetical protein [Marmoricola sp. RAF53]
MGSMHSELFAVVFMITIAVVPALAYLAVRLFGARETASDHPVVHH